MEKVVQTADGDMSEMTACVLRALGSLQKAEKPILIAIDGRCCVGKTTLAQSLQKEIGCRVIHMDDFFLRPEQRTEKRYHEPGGNVDYERFLMEVMEPLAEHRPFSYRPYDCKRQALSEVIEVQPCDVAVIEGSYSCHPALWDFYDLRIFMDVGKEEQLRRIAKRNGEAALAVFREKWIPLEEAYIKAYDIEGRCDLRFGLPLKEKRTFHVQ
ncbi:MAG: AAA family ATPase [Lachnospiraceae bacterium]|nr:AAA family ATPase [Lachnospiraceae bacterium]